MSSDGKVFDTASRVMERGSRPAACAARAMRSCTALRLWIRSGMTPFALVVRAQLYGRCCERTVCVAARVRSTGQHVLDQFDPVDHRGRRPALQMRDAPDVRRYDDLRLLRVQTFELLIA